MAIATQITILATVWALTRLPCVVIFAAPESLPIEICVPLTALRKGFLQEKKRKKRRKNRRRTVVRIWNPHGSDGFPRQEAVRRATLYDRYKRHRRLLVTKFLSRFVPSRVHPFPSFHIFSGAVYR